ncbi:hypothetical protein BC628DRAFT_1333748 [Trametes gibbosa]|nr:hypothetical protein BC628DRAFT_1333748 [Trametes gibbosa]
MLSLRAAVLLLSPCLALASGSVINILPQARSIQPRATVNGSCISAPDTSCVSLVGLCVTRITTGQIGSTVFWSDPVCFAAATCASMGSVLDAACCAGTCRQPSDIASMDYSNLYYSIVGQCAFQTGGCSLTWSAFVNWYYSVIQSTNTNLWPASGDDVQARWADMATWTGFCAGTNCADGAIPYTNLDDWLHYSTAVTATSPGTPDYVPIFSTLDDNLDNWTPNLLWSCLLDDPTECWWDYGPPPPGTVAPDPDSDMLSVSALVGKSRQALHPNLATFRVNVSSSSPFAVGRAPSQPPNMPPPVYVNGELFPLKLNGTVVHWNITTRRREAAAPLPPRASLPGVGAEHALRTNATGGKTKRAIVPATCRKLPLDIPSTLPVLTYYCPLFPGICQNIRSHPDWDSATDTMQLTYDPFDGGKRRKKVCNKKLKTDMQNAGRCDPLQHDPNYWKVSCDEFPFSSSLEGGTGNSVTLAVTNAEQDLQGTLQSYLSQLRTVAHNGKTSWGKASKCHRYILKLVDSIPAGAPPEAMGSLDAGSTFFASGETFRYTKSSNVLSAVPPSYTVDTPYDASQTKVPIPKVATPVDCSPQACKPKPSSALVSSGALLDEDVMSSPVESPSPEEDTLPTPTSTPIDSTTHVKRQASSCVPQSSAALPMSSAQASAVAVASSSTAKAAAAAAAAALASAANASAAQAAAAAAAISAANALVPAAAALAAAASDASLASAIATAQSLVSAAESALNTIFSLPNLPDWLITVRNQVSSASSSVTTAIESSANVVNPATPAPPIVEPSKNPSVNSGPPAGAPAATCFGAGSKGALKLGDTYFVNENGIAPVTLVDAGSDAYFGLEIPTPRYIAQAVGCPGVYLWVNSSPLQPDFRVDCATMELGQYWSGAKLTCYAYREASQPGIFAIICANNIGTLYSCLQQSGNFGTIESAYITWVPS